MTPAAPTLQRGPGDAERRSARDIALENRQKSELRRLEARRRQRMVVNLRDASGRTAQVKTAAISKIQSVRHGFYNLWSNIAPYMCIYT